MFRSLIAAAAVALSIGSMTPAAKADVDVEIFLGGGHRYAGYDYYDDDYGNDCVWVGHRYKCFGGPVIRPHFIKPHHRPLIIHRMSCGAARELVRDYGFHRVKATDCKGKKYGFTARKNGKRYFVTVSAVSGRINAERI